MAQDSRFSVGGVGALHKNSAADALTIGLEIDQETLGYLKWGFLCRFGRWGDICPSKVGKLGPSLSETGLFGVL